MSFLKGIVKQTVQNNLWTNFRVVFFFFFFCKFVPDSWCLRQKHNQFWSSNHSYIYRYMTTGHIPSHFESHVLTTVPIPQNRHLNLKGKWVGPGVLSQCCQLLVCLVVVRNQEAGHQDQIDSQEIYAPPHQGTSTTNTHLGRPYTLLLIW